MNLSALNDYLKNLVNKSAMLSLDAADPNLPPELQKFLQTVPGQQMSISPAADGIDLQGSTLKISGSTTDKWQIQGMTDVGVNLEKFKIVINNEAQATKIEAQADGKLPFTASVNAPVTLTALHQKADPWRITLRENAVAGITPLNLFQLGRLGTLPFDIPPNLDLFDKALTINQKKFQIDFYPNTSYEARYIFEVTAPQAEWVVVKDLISFDGIDVRAFLMTNSVGITLIGHLTLGGIKIIAGIGMSVGETWTGFLRPAEGNTFPGIAAVAELFGGADFSRLLNDGFAALKLDAKSFDTAIREIAFAFNWKKASLEYFNVASLLTVGALKLDVLMSFPQVKIRGSLHENKPLAVKEMLGGLNLPTDAVPDDLRIVDADFEARPKDKFYSIEMAVDNIWRAGPVELKKIGVSVSHSEAEGLVGSFDCLLAFAAIDIFLTAGYINAETGWRFSGELTEDSNIKIGDLIFYLAEKFGIGDVPEPIKSLNLSGLEISYETGTGKFNFTCTGDFTVSDTAVRMIVAIDVARSAVGDEKKRGVVKGSTGYSARFAGSVAFSQMNFDLIFNTQSAGINVFVAAYSRDKDKPSSISLRDLVAAVSKETAEAVPTGISIDLKEAKFIFFNQGKTKQFSFGLDLGAKISLSNLPLVGDKLPSGFDIGISNLQIGYSSAKFGTTEIDIINPILPEGVAPLPVKGLPKGINIAADLRLGPPPSFALSLGDSGNQSPSPDAVSSFDGWELDAGNADAAALGGTKWFNVQKQFGIFHFKRIGIGYENNILLFSLDAAVAFGPLALSVAGLSVGSPLDKFEPVFDISGLGISYNNPPLLIAGAFLKVPKNQLPPDVEFQFDGAAILRATEYSLAAVGSYAQFKSGAPSLFIFAQMEAALGGPPEFFVTGLMAGFGFNRKLEMPELDEVLNFPLLALGQPPAPGASAASQDPMHVLEVLEGQAPAKEGGKLKQWIRPSSGDYWLAVGIEFTTYELLRARALLIVEFGNDFQIALLGLASLKLPQRTIGDQCYAFVELQLSAIFKPQDGFFGMSAVLSSNSFVIARDCHLTGGFAFYLWFGASEHAGQFVTTLGGYHPAFKPPKHFPLVPRLGINWSVSETVSIKGGAYFALTPSCVMAGGALEILFNAGDLRAWFTAHADLIVAWKPFSFEAKIAVEIGVSYRLNLLFCHKTISISVGATLDLWGPPTGGTVRVHLSILSFTVNFGADNASRQKSALSWSEFKTLLPPPNDVCKITVSTGLYKTQENKAAHDDKKVWIVRASDFGFFTQSAIPASHLKYGAENGGDSFGDESRSVDIRPMNLRDVASVHHLKLYRDSIKTPPVDISNWRLEPRLQNMPESLWGTPPAPFTQIPANPTANVVANQIIGLTVRTPQPSVSPSRGIIPLKELAEGSISQIAAPLAKTAVPSTEYVPVSDDLTVGKIGQIMNEDVKKERDALFRALQTAAVYSGANGALNNTAQQAGHIFTDSPMRQN